MKINLLTVRLQKKSPLGVYAKASLKKLILGFMVSWLAGAAFFFFLTINISYYKKNLAKLKNDLKGTDLVLKEKDAFLKRVQESDKLFLLLKDGFKKDISWSDKLAKFADLVPEEMWLREISLRREGIGEQSRLFLDIAASVGYLRSDEELLGKINNFIEAVKKEKSFMDGFEEVSLLEINKSKLAETNAMDFRLTFSLAQAEGPVNGL